MSDAYKTTVVSTFPWFETKIMSETTANAPMAGGLIVDFGTLEEDDREAKEQMLLKAMNDMKMTQRPCMIMDLAPVRDLELTIKGEDWIESDTDKLVKQPKCARIVIPVSQIVDLTNVQPVMGSSIIRCNGCIPCYNWFRAANLELHAKNNPMRIVPFPMEQKSGDITYQAMRVVPAEFRAYQELLDHAVSQDGVEKGFMIAAKYSYQVLVDRGHKEITFSQVGYMVTDIVIMGKSVMRGILITNSTDEDFVDLKRCGIYF